jgi:hypothetical protein
MSIIQPELNAKYKPLQEISDEDMKFARSIVGEDSPIYAVIRPPPEAKKLRFICWYIYYIQLNYY